MTANFVVFLIGLALVPYAIPALMPTWRWWLGVTGVFGGLLAALWMQHWIVSSRPGYHDGAGGAIGLVFSAIVTVGFATGVVVRGCTLLLATRGLALRHVLVIGVLGFAIVPAYFYVPTWWHAWKMRPPSPACKDARFGLKIGNAGLIVPSSPAVSLYTGGLSRENLYVLGVNPSLRDLCSVTDDGKRAIRASLLTVRTDDPTRSTDPFCGGDGPEWTKTFCRAREARKRGRQDDVDFPLEIHVFASNETRLGYFGGSHSTFDDSRHPASRPNGPHYIQSDRQNPDGPLTFECIDNQAGYWCKTSYPWRDGANIEYTFRSPRDEVVARGSRIDEEARKFLAGFLLTQ